MQTTESPAVEHGTTFTTCDHPGCRKMAKHEMTIFDEDGEDQGRELLCNQHYNY